MRLLSADRTTLIPHLEIAETLWARTKGLIGRDHLPMDRALWIKRCNSIHTFFMRFPIDLVFVDRALVVRKTLKNVKPGRIVPPVWRATSVIELSAGFLDTNPVQPGEQLHVDSALS